jgi:uncharacterized membrane protein
MENLTTYLKQNKAMLIISAILLAIIVTFLVITIPIVIHDIEVRKIANQIEEVQLKIELNKEQWNTCYTNMELWHTENEENRQILNDLMRQYNDMVGFTTA